MLRSALVWLGFAQPEGTLAHAGGHGHGHAHGRGEPHGHTHGVVDPTIATTTRGIWAVKWSFVILAITSVLQLAVVFATGSVALLADTIHNIGDAVTAVPLWIAFRLVRRPPTQCFTYGLGRVEDLAGVAIVAIILFSAIFAGYEAISRLIHPQPITLLWPVAGAGVIGFIGNEAVAVFRIRVGREIESAALIADGYHARTDGLTSLAVVAGAAGVWLGFPLADPIVGLVITIAIFGIVRQSSKAVFTRLLDGVEPGVVAEITHAAEHVGAVRKVLGVRARWLGHRLTTELDVAVADGTTVREAEAISAEVEAVLAEHMPALASAHVRVRSMETAEAEAGSSHDHGKVGHHHAPDPVPVQGTLARGVLEIIATASGERMRFLVSSLAAGAEVAVVIARPDRSETVRLLPRDGSPHLLLSTDAPAEPHEFDAHLVVRAGGHEEALPFRMTEPAGHVHFPSLLRRSGSALAKSPACPTRGGGDRERPLGAPGCRCCSSRTFLRWSRKLSMKPLLLLGLAVLVAAAPATLRAQEARGGPASGGAVVIASPAQAVAAALADSPALRGAGAVQQAVRGDALSAPLRPNPDLSTVIENFGGIGGRGTVGGGRGVQTTVGASQRIELGGKRGARIGLAGESNNVAGLDFTLAQLDLARDVVTALADAVASARLVDIEVERARLAGETVRVARGRVEAGRDPLVQQRRAEVTRTTALIAAERARREAEVSLRNLTVLLGVPQVHLPSRQPWFDEIRPSGSGPGRVALAGGSQGGLAGSPDLARLDAVVVQRRANLTLQRANAVPDVTVQGYVRRLEETRETAFVVGAAIPLPIYDRNQGGIARAQAELLQAEVGVERGRLAVMASLTTAERRLDLARRAAQALRTETVPAAEQAARFASGGFAAGKFTYLEVLDAQRVLSDARAQLNDTLRDMHARAAEVNRLSGRTGGLGVGAKP